MGGDSRRMKKPCIQCDKECDILPIELGDSFTLTYLRICSPECMFMTAYDYLHDIGCHRDFRTHLSVLQSEEDRKAKDEFIRRTTEAFLQDFGDHLKLNPNLLSVPVPKVIEEMFGGRENLNFPFSSGKAMKWAQPSKEDRILWAKKHIKSIFLKK